MSIFCAMKMPYLSEILFAEYLGELQIYQHIVLC